MTSGPAAAINSGIHALEERTDRAEARRLVIDGIEIMKRLEQQGPLDTNAQDTLNKLNEIATVLTSFILERVVTTPTDIPLNVGSSAH